MIGHWHRAAALAAGALLFAGAAHAHHSGAAYDMDHFITIEGTVDVVNWTNPHITYQVTADPKDGKPGDVWSLEVSSPGVMTRSGWSKRSLQPGDHAIFQVAPLRDGGHGGSLVKVTLSNGQVLTYSLSPSEQ